MEKSCWITISSVKIHSKYLPKWIAIVDSCLVGLFVCWFHFWLVVGWLVDWLVTIGLSFWKVLWLRPSEPAVGRHFYIGSVQPWKAGGIEDPVFFFEAISRGAFGVEGMSGGCWWCVDVNCIVWWAMMSVLFQMVHGGVVGCWSSVKLNGRHALNRMSSSCS